MTSASSRMASDSRGQALATQQVATLKQKFSEESERPGVISKVGAGSVDFLKRTILRPFGNETNSKSIEEQLASLEKQAAQIKSGQPDAQAQMQFKQQLAETEQNLGKYASGNKLGGDIAKGVVVTGAVTSALAAAPFTGGASIALATGVGVGTSIGTDYLDKNTSENKTTLNPLGDDNRYTKKDALVSGTTGALIGLAAPVGRVAGKALVGQTQNLLGSKAMGSTAATFVQKEVSGSVTGGTSAFVNTLAREGAQQGSLNSTVLKNSIQAVPAGLVGGSLGALSSQGVGTVSNQIRTVAGEHTVSKAAADIAQRQLSSGVSSGTSKFVSTVAREGVQRGELNAEVLAAGAKAAPQGFVEGSVSALASGDKSE